jgi:hypothetical protein
MTSFPRLEHPATFASANSGSTLRSLLQQRHDASSSPQTQSEEPPLSIELVPVVVRPDESRTGAAGLPRGDHEQVALGTERPATKSWSSPHTSWCPCQRQRPDQ